MYCHTRGHGSIRLLIALAMIATLVVFCFSGCGGPNAISGGSVPLGLSRIEGTVVRADNVLKQVVDTPITLTLGTNFERGSTDLSGGFDFGKVVGGEYVLSVTPARGSDLDDVWSWRFVLPADAVVQLFASVWPENLDTTTIATVTLAPPTISLRKGETIRFAAAAKDENGLVLPYAPSLLLVGEVGTLYPEGTFTAEHAGTATLTAWMAGKQATATIEVFDSKSPGTGK